MRVILSELLGFFVGDLTISLILHEVKFVTHQHYADVLLTLAKKRLKPKLYIFESRAFSYIVDNESTQRLSVMRHRDGSVLFLA